MDEPWDQLIEHGTYVPYRPRWASPRACPCIKLLVLLHCSQHGLACWGRCPHKMGPDPLPCRVVPAQLALVTQIGSPTRRQRWQSGGNHTTFTLTPCPAHPPPHQNSSQNPAFRSLHGARTTALQAAGQSRLSGVALHISHSTHLVVLIILRIHAAWVWAMVKHLSCS